MPLLVLMRRAHALMRPLTEEHASTSRSAGCHGGSSAARVQPSHVTLSLICRFASGAGPEDAVDDWRHEWEIDPATLEIGLKVVEGEFGTVHKVRNRAGRRRFSIRGIRWY